MREDYGALLSNSRPVVHTRRDANKSDHRLNFLCSTAKRLSDLNNSCELGRYKRKINT